MIIKELLVTSTKLYSLAVFLLLMSCENISIPSSNLQVANVEEKTESKVIPDLQVAKEQLTLNQLEGKWYYQNQPFSGQAVVHYPNGALAESTGFYNGKREGIAQKWYPDNLLQKESYYIANKLNGVVKVWSPNPNSILIVESNYENGVRNGFQTRWYSSGQMLRRTHLNMGKEEGMQQAWLENGKIYINYEAKNGRSFGLKKANLCYELENEIVQFTNDK